ncbi:MULTISPECIES: DUF1810 domain-containing protein [Microbulbifer]|uniref:DUF1810 domain-containing protein n=1 Tax=Microbulbifer TaxID=48073 RepID=UPI001CD74FED|nr:DUF1810 domain-containing protein [Microbulbifer agarilyticus]MCA0899890.1 DUF1810 domain-containing protein [Microbulbifer agarilyticus]
MNDPHNLQRFLDTQASCYPEALAEIHAGNKHTHWMWFIFPQIDGLGRSSTARHYAIKSRDEAEAYLAHPILGTRLRECCAALLAVKGRSAHQIFGSPDDMKLKSSMTLFTVVAGQRSEFMQVLQRYYCGELDTVTLELLCGD